MIGLQYWPGDNNTNNTGFVWIGTFDDKFNFSLIEYTDVLGGNGCLLGMQVGNFDNQTGSSDPSKAHNPNLQIALFENQGDGEVPCTPIFDAGYLHVKIVNINVPTNFDPLNPPPPTNGLVDAADVVPSFPYTYNALQSVTMSIGDLQGRSLRLGTPEKVVIPLQRQPDIVLGIPPMHIDYIKPNTNVLDKAKYPDCQNPTIPCVLNVTVLPSVPSPGLGFATMFNFSSQASSNTKRKSTISWGLAAKVTVEADISYGDEIEGSEVDIKNTTSDTFNQSFSSQYDTYKGTTDDLSITTGFADHIFFTERQMNVYYYPVLGRTGCPASNPDCPDNQKIPTYVVFSVPDQVTYWDVDATMLEWYQPVHEPGNILSYPWSKLQLQQGFSSQLNILSQDPPPWRGTDTSSSEYKTTWSGTQKDSSSMGITNSFSNDLSISYSTYGGLKDIFSASFSASVDVTASTSLNMLNVSTAALNASTGIAVTKPNFDSDTFECCPYQFAGYIFGEGNPNSTFQQISVDDQDGNPVDIQQLGPLYVGFLVDPFTLKRAWWQQVYSVPDVALNHPARWSWEKSTQTASFYHANRTGDLSPLNQPFYQMKGFFISKASDQNSGPNLSQAIAGDQLTLTARVYNFSMVDTNATIHVRFYGQYYCSSGAATEKSCVGNNNTTCTIANLCGDSFVIGEAEIGTISGFNSPTNQGNLTNWVTASVNFNTTNYPNAYMVFWVVTWMEDANGKPVKELTAHGLTAIPSSTVRQITDIAVEPYSNNVGMYGVNSPFFICPSITACVTAAIDSRNAETGRATKISAIKLTGEPQMVLGQRDKVTARVDVAGGAVGPLTVAYYDGKPDAGGKLIDVQRIPHIAANSTYQHRIFFKPESCGDHTLYAQAFGPGVPSTVSEGHIKNVRIDQIAAVQSLMNLTAKANLLEPVREHLQSALKIADRSFREQQQAAGLEAIQLYIKLIESDLPTITREVANRLIGPAQTIVSCVNSRT